MPIPILTPAGAADDSPVVACEDCGSLVLVRLVRTHDAVCPARLARAIAKALA